MSLNHLNRGGFMSATPAAGAAAGAAAAAAGAAARDVLAPAERFTAAEAGEAAEYFARTAVARPAGCFGEALGMLAFFSAAAGAAGIAAAAAGVAGTPARAAVCKAGEGSPGGTKPASCRRVFAPFSMTASMRRVASAAAVAAAVADTPAARIVAAVRVVSKADLPSGGAAAAAVAGCAVRAVAPTEREGRVAIPVGVPAACWPSATISTSESVTRSPVGMLASAASTSKHASMSSVRLRFPAVPRV